jgi:hypothetical protein
LLLTRALGHTVRLVEPTSSAEQVQVLTGLAADLRRTAVELAQQGPAADLPVVAGLYNQVVRRGLVAPTRGLPAGQAAAVVRQLEEDERAAAQAAGQALPLLAGHLQGMADTARQAGRDIRSRAAGLAGPFDRSVPAGGTDRRALLSAVVLHGLRLTEERDPLRRADCCADVADCIVEAIVWNSASGETERATRLGGYLGPVMERGVNGNLDRVQVQTLDPRRQAELERVCSRAGRSTALLQKNLERAPPTVRHDLRRLLETAHRWHERSRATGQRLGKSQRLQKTRPGHDKDGPHLNKAAAPDRTKKREPSRSGWKSKRGWRRHR